MLIDTRKILIGAASFILLFTSCEESSVIGLDVQPEGDLVNVVYTDTLSVIAYTVKEDSLRTDEKSIFLLGSYVDPVFGYAEASYYTQLLPSKFQSDIFGASPVLDSVVLQLGYSGKQEYYGKLTDQTIKVFEMTEDFTSGSPYYSNKTFTASSTELANYTFTPKPADSVKVNNINTAPHLRIRLADTFGQALLNGGTSSYTDNSAFLSLLKGLYITPANSAQASGDGALLYFNRSNPASKLTIYYNDSLSYDLSTGGVAAHVNHFVHDYTSAAPLLQAQLTDSTLGKDLIYVQPNSGLKTKLFFPTLKNLIAENKVAINKAEIVFLVDTATVDSSFSVPANLYLKRGNLINPLVDAFFTDFGGAYNAAKNEYSFQVKRHLQAILDDKVEDGLDLISLNDITKANRVVLGGSNNIAYKLKLKLTYTKIN